MYLEYTILLKNVYFEYTKFYNILYSRYTILMRGVMRRAIEATIETWATLKDDRRDAQRLPSEMTKVDSKLKTVYVPTTRVESLRGGGP